MLHKSSNKFDSAITSFFNLLFLVGDVSNVSEIINFLCAQNVLNNSLQHLKMTPIVSQSRLAFLNFRVKGSDKFLSYLINRSLM